MAWYHTPGKEQDAVISTCVSLSRNLTDHPFPSRLDAKGAREVIAKIGEVLEQNGFSKTDFADISRTMAYALVEQQYVTPAFVKKSLPHALYRNDPCHLSATVCGDDHVQIQAVLPGAALRDVYEAARKIEQLLDERFELAFDERWGYLTPNLDHLGTAMRPSVILCLPLLAETGRLEPMTQCLDRLGFILHGLYGDGSHAPGSLYQLTPVTYIGLTEEDILGKTEVAVARILDKERGLRNSMTEAERDRLTDRIHRAEGILRYAHVLPSIELLDHLGYLRLGIAMGMVSTVDTETLTALLIDTLPATLTLASPSPISTDHALDLFRARVVKEKLEVCGS